MTVCAADGRWYGAVVKRGVVLRRCSIVAILAISAVVYLLPVLRRGPALGVEDWDMFIAYEAVSRRSILEYGQLPLWTPYHAGGLPFLANPQTKIFSPAAGLVLAAGPVWGVKIEILVQYIVGLVGTYACARRFDVGRAGALFGAAVFMYSGLFVSSVAPGMFVFLAAAFIPWCVLLFDYAVDDARYGVGAGAAMGLMVLYGGVHMAALNAVALVVLATVRLVLRDGRARRIAAALGVTFVSAFAWCAVKVLPAIELLRRLPRIRSEYSGFSVESLRWSLFTRNQGLGSELPPDVPGFWRGTSWGVDENGTYIGIAVALLIAIGLFAKTRRRMVVAITLAILVWLSLGDRAPVSLWRALHRLPVFESMRVAQRFRFVWLFFAALVAGIGLDAALAFLVDRGRAVGASVGVVAIGLVVGDLFTTRRMYEEGFSVIAPPMSPAGSFRQIEKLPLYGRTGWESPEATPTQENAWSAQYPAVQQNMGVVAAYEPIADELRSSVQISTNDGYRGEVFLAQSHGTVSFAAWSPNRLTVDVDATDDDVVVINQNYFSGWSSAQGSVVEREGLLAVPVPRGRRRIELVYRPRSVLLGLSITGATALGTMLWLLRSRRLRKRRSM